jgi:hypothetical protein
LELQKVEIRYVLKDLKRGTTFSIGPSQDSKWISNKNSEKFLGLKFNRISSWNFKFERTLDKIVLIAPSDQLNSWRRV